MSSKALNKNESMLRENSRNPGEGYCIKVILINGEPRNDLSAEKYCIENISKGGFRFVSDLVFEIDDKLRVLLQFPDGRIQEVFGRICYCDENKKPQGYAYGFSVLEGFYTLYPGIVSG